MATVAAPNAVEVLDFEFKLHSRLKLFENESSQEFNDACSLVASASRYGLVFVGTPSKSFQVIRMQDIEASEKETSSYPRRVIDIPSRATHLSVNCDATKLSVVAEKDGCPIAIVYDVLSFLKQQVVIIKEIRLSMTPGVKVLETDWNPAVADIFTACKSDGSLGVYEFKQSQLDIHDLPSASGATCFCWSPKGKQIAVGSKDGKITQYKPDLKAVKVINPPQLEDPASSIIVLKWITSFQFIGIYKATNNACFVIVVDAPKAGNPVYTNYYDICYSYGNTRPQQFYMVFESTWNVLVVASSNSTDVGVMAVQNDKWIQWILNDSGRAELPLSATKQETLPIGCSLNMGTTKLVQIGENTKLSAPMLLVLSDHGKLCCFYAVNSKPSITPISSPPENVAGSDLQLFVKPSPLQIKKDDDDVKVTKPAVPLVQQPPLLTKPVVQPVQQPQLFANPAQNKQQQLFNTPPSSAPFLFSTNAFESKPVQVQPGPTPVTPPTKPTFTVPHDTPKENKPITTSYKEPPIKELAPAPAVALEKVEVPISKGKSNGRIAVQEETEVMISKYIQDDCVALEAELNALLQRGREIKINVGSDLEATHMAQQANKLEEFLKALKDTSAIQAGEIHTLKQNVIQTWAWYEEARSRFTTSQDPMLVALLQARPLDPASQRQLDEINHLIYYLESQLLQANRSLDEQWDNFQDSLKNYKNRMVQIPTIEAIYQSMVKQNAILQRQTYIMKDISNRLKLHKKDQTQKVLISLKKEGDIEEELSKLQISSENLTQLHFNRILDRQRKLTQHKRAKLHDFLAKRKATHVSINKPQLNNSTVHLTSLLSAPLSPIGTEVKTISEKVDFLMSTPKPPQKIGAKAQGGLFTDDIVKDGVKSMFDGAGSKTNLFGVPATVASVPASSTTELGAGILSKPQQNALDPNKFTMFSVAPKVSAVSEGAAFKFTTNLPKVSSIVTSPTPANLTSQASKPILENVPKIPSSTFSFSTAQGTAKTPFSFAPKMPVTTGVLSPISNDKPSSPNAGVSSANKTTSATSIFNTFSFGSLTTTTTNTVTTTASFSVVNQQIVKTTAITTPSVVPLDTKAAIASAATANKTVEVSSSVKVTAVTTSSIFGAFKGSSPFGQGTNSVFGKPTTTSGTFGQVSSTTPASQTTSATSGFKFVATTPSASTTATTVLGLSQTSSTTPTSATSTVSSTTTNIFGNKAVSTTTPATAPAIVSTTSVIPGGGATTTVFTATTQQNPAVLSQKSLTAPVTSAITSASAFGTTSVFATTTSSIFGGSTNTVFGSKPSIFGATTTTTPTSQKTPAVTNIFAATTTATPSIFGGTTQTQTSIFAATTTAPSTQTPTFANTTQASTGIFAAATKPPSTQPPIFGGTTQAQTNIFGATTAAAPITQSSIFGGTTQATTSIFGATTTTPSTQTSIFGSTTQAPTNIFGATTQAATGIFASTTTTTPTTQTSIFGNTTQAASTFPASNVFGTATTTTAFGNAPFAASTPSPFSAPSTTGSIFGQPATFGGGSIFGATTTTTNVFGNTGTFGTNSNVFAPASTATSPFGNTSSVFAPAPFGATPTTSQFGQTTQSATFGNKQSTFGAFGNTNSFGFNSLNVGSPTTTSSNVFGSSFGQTNQNPFGGSPSQEQKSPFSGGSLFGNPPSSTFGGSSVFNKPAAASFGSAPVFGSPAFGSQQTTFGGTFGNASQGSFTSSGQTVQQGGFGSPAFQKPATAFGSPPVFGNASPSFGTPPSFGGAPAFGAAPAFGSPQKIFGSSTTTESTFGNPTQNSSFGNIANQNTLGFGNLAQQVGSPTQPTGFTGGSSFSNWR